jgi:hypothetical protein
VTGAQLLGLFDEAQMGVGATAFLQGRFDPGRTLTHHDNGGTNLVLRRGVEQVHHHWPSAKMVKGLRTR